MVPAVARAQAALPKLAVMPLVGKRIEAQITSVLDDLLVDAVYSTGRYNVIGAADINAMLGLEKMRDLAGCSDAACAAQIGGALGVDYLLSGNASVLGNELIVSLTLIDSKH
ncbi:MAG TPA: hypothetical protein VFH51_08715, partial [Myxococcota bacterium]|nr:hypothetical protein [Myxococcota bacterium]